MACSACSTGGCATGGCNSKSACSSGQCNRVNTYDWLSDLALPDYMTAQPQLIEVSFKNGARKDFFFKPNYITAEKGDHVVVESAAGGYDIGLVTLTGELVRLQMKKKAIADNGNFLPVLRAANERDMERLLEARAAENETMVQARVIARDLGLQMKIGDVEYQGDKRKVTFYYTADGRVDFRELIRIYAREFRVKIEMRQIGARQESARIGGIGACGRELCCSTWLSDFKSVSTLAARYQNLAINQSKLSGQCGRLKCCLNYELSCYLDALKDFPSNVQTLETAQGTAKLVKTDIFKRLMFFVYPGSGDFEAISVDRVKEIVEMNRKGVKPEDLRSESQKSQAATQKAAEIGFVDGTGMIELEELRKNDPKRKGRNQRKERQPKSNAPTNGEKSKGTPPTPPAAEGDTPAVQPPADPEQRNNRRNRNRPSGKPKGEGQPQAPQNKAPREPREQKEPREPKEPRTDKNQTPKGEAPEQGNNTQQPNKKPQPNRRRNHGRPPQKPPTPPAN